MAAPTRSQLLLPLLQALHEAGGSARPRDVYDAVAEKARLSEEERARTFDGGKRQGNLFERSIRWCRQSAVGRNLIGKGTRGVWSLTDIGHDRLSNATPGVVVTIFETSLGTALWSTLEAAVGVVADGSVDLFMSSPPYPSARKSYGSGDLDEASWVSFMFDAIVALGPKLTPTGSMMLNVAETFVPGLPVKSEHLSRLRIRLADETRFRVLDTLTWLNTSRLPTPHTWVAQRRIRLKQSAETILWLSTQPFAKADNRRLLKPYGPKMLRHLEAGSPRAGGASGRRPSGNYVSERGFARDNGGSIADNVLQAGAAGGNRDYYRGARSEGLPLHPAVMPQKIAEKCILLATEPGDMVMDAMAGSMTVGAAAEKLGRRWICGDMSLAYGLGARHRFAMRDEDAGLVAAGLRAVGGTPGVARPWHDPRPRG